MGPFTEVQYICGLDLGQLHDFTALAAAQRVKNKEGLWEYTLVGLHRYPLGTSYNAIVADVASRFGNPPLAGSTLLVDATGVGRAVVDQFRVSGIDARVTAVTITGGLQTTHDVTGWHVPKKDLIGCLQMLMGTRRFHIVPSLKEASTLRKEMETFKVKVKANTGKEVLEAFKARDHDDTVLATSMIAWWGEKGRPYQTPLRTYRLGPSYDPEKRVMRVVACSMAELPALEIQDHWSILVLMKDLETGDDNSAGEGRVNESTIMNELWWRNESTMRKELRPSNESLTLKESIQQNELPQPDLPLAYPIKKLLGHVAVKFVPLRLEDVQDDWGNKLPQYGGKLPGEVMMGQQHGKKIWSAVLKKHQDPWEVIVIASETDGVALSAAMAVTDNFRLPRTAIYVPGEESWLDNSRKTGLPPDKHVYDVLMRSRGSVVG